MASNVANILATAQKVHDHADQKFPSTEAKTAGAKPAGEYMKAPYSMAAAPKTAKTASIADEAQSAGEGIKARTEMEAKVKQDQ